MSSLCIFRWFFLYFLFGQYIRADWPSSNSSNIQLLGLFSDIFNTSDYTTSPVQSRAMFKAAVLLSQQYNITIQGQFIGWQSVKTGGDVMNALSNTCLLISTSNIVGIVGPELSRESHFIAPFAAKIGIPLISYASTDPELSDRNAYSAFYRTVPSDNAAALVIAKLFIKFNWTSCIIIYQNDAFGSGGAKAITETFDNNHLRITEMIVFDIATLTIRGYLKHLLVSSSSRIVLVWATTDYTLMILKHALDCDAVDPQFTWILTGNVPLNKFDQTLYNKLNGMLIVEPVVGNVANAPINKTLLNAAYHIWQQHESESFPGSDNVDYYALFAFDATWTLIQALSKFCSTTTKNFTPCISFINASFCFDRYFLNSRSFFDIINNTTFLGVSGYVQFSPNVTDRMNGTYYVTKNVQRSSNGLNNIPVLVWYESSGWNSYALTNVIIWPGNSLIPPSGYATASGLTLRIAVTELDPFTMVKEIIDESGKTTTKLIGYVPDLIEILQKKMGFIPNITVLGSAQKYNRLIDAVANDVYDMLVADTTVTAGRREKVAFSAAIFDNSLRIITRDVSIVNVDFLSYLRPFSFILWITLLTATICGGFLISLFERQENEALQNRSMISLLLRSMWYSSGTILGYGVDFHVKTAAGRLLTIGLYILSLVSVAAYTARLAADLTIAKTNSIISGIDDINNGKIPSHRIGIITDSAMEEYYLREISRGNRNFYPLNSIDEMYSKLLNNIIDASIIDAAVVEYSTNNVYCNLTLVGTDFGKSELGIVYHKKWLYQHDLDVNILSLRESGVLDELKRKWFETNNCSRSSTASTAMTIKSMAGLFLTFGVISFMAILLFTWKERLTIKNYLSKLTKALRLGSCGFFQTRSRPGPGLVLVQRF